jgi:hypothetical protein
MFMIVFFFSRYQGDFVQFAQNSVVFLKCFDFGSKHRGPPRKLKQLDVMGWIVGNTRFVACSNWRAILLAEFSWRRAIALGLW